MTLYEEPCHTYWEKQRTHHTIEVQARRESHPPSAPLPLAAGLALAAVRFEVRLRRSGAALRTAPPGHREGSGTAGSYRARQGNFVTGAAAMLRGAVINEAATAHGRCTPPRGGGWDGTTTYTTRVPGNVAVLAVQLCPRQGNAVCAKQSSSWHSA
eukprot:gene13289-biopygen8009